MNINVDIKLEFLWGDEHFIKDEWGNITYIVGPNGTGKTVVAEKLKEQFKKVGLKVRYFSAERLNSLGNKWDKTGYLQVKIESISPYMLSIQNSDELKNLIVFHRHKVPTYIKEYEDMDGLFEGKLRQTVDKISDTGIYMAKKGNEPLI